MGEVASQGSNTPELVASQDFPTVVKTHHVTLTILTIVSPQFRGTEHIHVAVQLSPYPAPEPSTPTQRSCPRDARTPTRSPSPGPAVYSVCL